MSDIYGNHDISDSDLTPKAQTDLEHVSDEPTYFPPVVDETTAAPVEAAAPCEPSPRDQWLAAARHAQQVIERGDVVSVGELRGLLVAAIPLVDSQ